MKSIYRGFEIEVKREKCLAGYPLVYYLVFRLSDGWDMVDGFMDTEDTVRTVLKDMKSIIDDYYENPGEYEDSDIETGDA